jgi:long-chain acyl-CoA synthetase
VHALEEILASEPPASPPPAGATGGDVAMIVYTSGSTGRPKGVLLSHDNLLSNLRASNSLMGLSAADSILVVVPLSFIHGRMQLLLHAMIGGTAAFSAGFQYPQKIVAELLEHRVTGFSGVPYHVTALLERGGLGRRRLPDLRYVLVTGGALSAVTLRALTAALAGVAIHVAYGLTEASPRVTHLGAPDLLARPSCSGRPVPGVRVEILDEDGTPLGPGEVGEVVVSGPNVMRGYVSGDEVALGAIDLEGRLRTGDLGRLDGDGFLYVVGRKSEMIKTAGERVFPREIEEIIDAHPAVRESAALGVPDAMLGERIVACVVLETGARVEADDLRGHCLSVLPFARTPREIRFVDELPKTPSGKIDRVALAAVARFEQAAP